jgi:hypothetical protein
MAAEDLEIVVRKQGPEWRWMVSRWGQAPIKSGWSANEEDARKAAKKVADGLSD